MPNDRLAAIGQAEQGQYASEASQDIGADGVGGYRKQIRQQDDPHGEAHVALHLSYVSPPIQISTGRQAPLSIRPGNRADLSSKAAIAHRILSDNEELGGDAVGGMLSSGGLQLANHAHLHRHRKLHAAAG